MKKTVRVFLKNMDGKWFECFSDKSKKPISKDTMFEEINSCPLHKMNFVITSEKRLNELLHHEKRTKIIQTQIEFFTNLGLLNS
ncbi:hypothetical protein [Bacillus cereus]|uniref:Uncharacterized protein n=1 Tax=Bacillus cereus TaxID=1396 RepID=A0A161SGP9_BACCE|nr:hypothetical protein [Bacillus cereus]KZD71188.1 hypothetical protein B4088_0918 [Bacillus cereus]